ncbi:MAG TPA: glycosyltransferase [Candidatus Limnocylindrales bacterium]|nr:glycosyltransferase [Candidatus Limnocylindrales bacterium]
MAELRVAIVAANTFEHDSRLLRTATALAADGHAVTVVAFAAPGLAVEQTLREGVRVVRVDIDRTVAGALRPLPDGVRGALARALGFEPEATVLPAAPAHGADRLRAPLRRLVEIAAHARRVGPWTDAVVRAAPDAQVFHAKALIALPVIRAAAARTGGGFVYDIADIHTEAARLGRMPAPVRALVRGREAAWVREAAGLTAVSEAVAAEVERRFGVARPVTLLNCPPAWRPDEPGPPASRRLRDTVGVPPEAPIVLYQGGLSVDRGIEELVAALDEPALAETGAVVVLLGYGRLREPLLREAAARPGRLFVLQAVPPSELLEWTASADLCFVGQPPRTLNQRLNLANKLFESLMAGVPVLVAEGTEHCRLVTAEAVGRCCDVDSPRAIAEAAGAMLATPAYERERLRAHCRRVALERYTWEAQQAGLRELYRRLAAGEGQG